MHVRAASYVAALPEPEVASLTPSPEQRARLATFFEARSLPFDLDRLELGESVLEEGEHAADSGAAVAALGRRSARDFAGVCAEPRGRVVQWAAQPAREARGSGRHLLCREVEPHPGG